MSIGNANKNLGNPNKKPEIQTKQEKKFFFGFNFRDFCLNFRVLFKKY
jgi:hypothetical protein